jgi:glutathione synthase/RimK-type ligase-like ATP-grasp enzyme
MITAIGLANDKTFMHFVRQARAEGHGVRVIDLGEFAPGAWCCELEHGSSVLRLETAGRHERLDSEGGYYGRPVDLSPVLSDNMSNGWRQLLMAVSAHLECVAGPVVNRPGAHADNASKPLHEVCLARAGFQLPEALTSSDRDEIIAFIRECGPCIVKTLSGVRSTALAVNEASFADFAPEQGPVHVQRRVYGDDVRAHVVGHRVHAERIRSQGVDYRDRNVEAVHEPIELPPAMLESLVQTTQDLGLAFAGWDFKTNDVDYWCLEANPMPGYDGYDRRAGGAITRSLLHYLTRR